MIEYSRDFDPSAPFMDVIIAVCSDSGPQRSVGALLDTGAEISIIPQQIGHELELSPYTEMIIEAFDGRRQRVNLYAVTLEVAGTHLSGQSSGVSLQLCYPRSGCSQPLSHDPRWSSFEF